MKQGVAIDTLHFRLANNKLLTERSLLENPRIRHKSNLIDTFKRQCTDKFLGGRFSTVLTSLPRLYLVKYGDNFHFY